MPLLYIAAAFLVGVLVASWGQLPSFLGVGGVGVGIVGLLASRWVPGVRLVALCVLAATAGMWRYDGAVQASASGPALAAMVGQREVELRGVVDAPPEMRERGQNIRLRLTGVRRDDRWEAAQGALLLFAGLAPGFEYGDSLVVIGKLEEPPEFAGFDYRRYLALQGIRYVMQRPRIMLDGGGLGLAPLAWMHGLRARLSGVLGSTLPEPEASVAQGILLGDRSSFPRSLADSFAATGTTHILAISGYNITLIAAAIFALFTRIVGRNRATYAAALGIGLYAVLAGASPSVLRATAMGILVIVAYRVGRQSLVVNALAVSAAGLVAVQPFWLWDVGFQLSFLATVGLVFVARPLAAILMGAVLLWKDANPLLDKVAGLFVDSISITLAATIYTLPLIAFDFHTISLISPVANLFAVPALPPIIAAAAAIALAGLILLPLAQILAYLSWPFIAYLVGVVDLFASVPGAQLAAVPVSAPAVGACYAVLAAFTFALHLGRDGLRGVWLSIRDGWSFLERLAGVGARPLTAWVILPAALMAVAAWAVVLSLPDNKLQVTFLDVGEGDAILVKTPGNRKLLVDGGPSPQRLLNQLGHTMPFWDRTIDVVVVSHPDEDHLAGLLGVLDRYRVSLVVESPSSRSTPTYKAWQERIASKGVRRAVLRTGQQLRLGKLEVDAVYVPEPPPGVLPERDERDNRSIVLRLKMADVSFLLTGDTPAGAQVQLRGAADELKSTVLKVPHHGARDALDSLFLAAVAPRLAVISVGSDNSFGHPAPETIALLSGTRTLRTDERGAIQASTDGKRLWIRSRR